MRQLFSYLSLTLSLISLGLSAFQWTNPGNTDWRLWGAACSVVAYWGGITDIRKYAGNFQLLCIFLSMFSLGVSLDHRLPSVPFMTAAMIVSFMIFRKYFRKWFSESDFYLLDHFSAIASVGIYIVANVWGDYGWKGWVFPASVLGMNLFLATMDFLSTGTTLKYLKKGKSGIEIGNPAPSFSLPDKDGKIVSLTDYTEKRHVLLVFIRNDWCPSCRIKLRTYERHRQKFNEKNIELLTISNSIGGVDKDLASSLDIKFNVLYDEKMEVSRSYGVQLPPEVVGDNSLPLGLPLPASFLIDKSGIVRYTSRPDRIGEFLDPTTIFPVLERLN